MENNKLSLIPNKNQSLNSINPFNPTNTASIYSTSNNALPASDVVNIDFRTISEEENIPYNTINTSNIYNEVNEVKVDEINELLQENKNISNSKLDLNLNKTSRTKKFISSMNLLGIEGVEKEEDEEESFDSVLCDGQKKTSNITTYINKDKESENENKTRKDSKKKSILSSSMTPLMNNNLPIKSTGSDYEDEEGNLLKSNTRFSDRPTIELNSKKQTKNLYTYNLSVKKEVFISFITNNTKRERRAAPPKETKESQSLFSYFLNFLDNSIVNNLYLSSLVAQQSILRELKLSCSDLISKFNVFYSGFFKIKETKLRFEFIRKLSFVRNSTIESNYFFAYLIFVFEMNSSIEKIILNRNLSFGFSSKYCNEESLLHNILSFDVVSKQPSNVWIYRENTTVSHLLFNFS